MTETAIKRNKPFIRRWIKALRSGDYNQIQGALHSVGNNNDPFGYCCLGVACRISSKAKIAGVHVDGTAEYSFFNDYCFDVGSLPAIMLIHIGLTNDELHELIDMNDEHENNFDQIADYLERKVLNEA